MSDWNDEGQFFGGADGAGDSQTNPIRALREKAESDSATIKELRAELQKIKDAQRTTGVADLLKSKGLDPIVADLVPKDVEATPEALDAWYAKYGKAFASTSAGSDEADGDGDGSDDSAAGSTIPEGEQDALQDLLTSTQQRVSPQASADLQRKLQNAQTLEELLAVTQQGQPGTPKPLFG